MGIESIINSNLRRNNNRGLKMTIPFRDEIVFNFNDGRGINVNQLDVEGQPLVNATDEDKAMAVGTIPRMWSSDDIKQIIQNVTGISSVIRPVALRYATAKITFDFEAADFTGAYGSSSDDENIAVADYQALGSSYIGLAIPVSFPDLTSIELAPAYNQSIVSFIKLINTITIEGVDYKDVEDCQCVAVDRICYIIKNKIKKGKTMSSKIINALKPRALLIANAVGHHLGHKDGRKMTRWEHPGDIWCKHFNENKDGTYNILFIKKGDRFAGINLINIQPIKIRDLMVEDPIVLEKNVIDRASVEIHNTSGIVQEAATYESIFQKMLGSTQGEESSFTSGFSVSIRNTFTAGNDSTPVKNETEISAETHSEWSKQTSSSSTEETSQSRGLAIPVAAPPLGKITLFAERNISKMERQVKGFAELEHKIIIGRYEKGWWGEKRWDSFADLLHILRGNAGDNIALGRHFRKNPYDVSDLQKPLSLPFEQIYKYDNVTDVKITYS